ncbi:MAG: hypothetical protein GF368_01060 [Candidatus Aenigmarchaeota archaeon]|nr:hypothetical protein [Candidatus Aenigmarchaeota archaeon]
MIDRIRGYGERVVEGIRRIRDRAAGFQEEMYGIPDRRKLTVSAVLDGIGLIEMGPFDPLYGAAQGAWIWLAYNDLPGAIGSFTEESLPYTDIFPSCTAAHIRHGRRQNEDQEV